MKEEKYYFGYFMWIGRVCPMKWVGDRPIGGVPHPIIWKHQLDDKEKQLDLKELESIYPYQKELNK